MDSLITLAIVMAIGLFFEPGWRLHPGARSAIAEERERHHHEHREEQHEDAGPNAQGEKPDGDAEPPVGLLGRGRTAFESFNEKVGSVVSASTTHIGTLAASGVVWLRSPVGIGATTPYVLLAAWAVWWMLDQNLKDPPTPTSRPVSPLAPELGLAESRELEGPMNTWPGTATILAFGAGLGLAASTALIRRARAGGQSAPVLAPTAGSKARSALEVKCATAELGPTGLAKAALPKASVEPKAASAKAGEWRAPRGRRAAADEAGDVEKGKKGGRRRIPEEYSLWTPRTSWTTPSRQGSEGEKLTPQVSWGETSFDDAAAAAAARAAEVAAPEAG
mmetsp:Transcript_40410/g.126083  ORF Transcript_40410/g.126083 Transcript_40410/m.126083 type:complete len:335 (+) Transcript_40410:62-1066(+)